MDRKAWLGTAVNPRLGTLTWLGFVAFSTILLSIDWFGLWGVEWASLFIGMHWGVAVMATWVAMSRPWHWSKLVFGALAILIAVVSQSEVTEVPRIFAIYGIFFIATSVGLPLLRMPAWGAGQCVATATYQFSIRGLMIYTLIVAIWMAIVRRSPEFIEGMNIGVPLISGITLLGLASARQCLVTPYRWVQVIVILIAWGAMMGWYFGLVSFQARVELDYFELIEFCTAFSGVLIGWHGLVAEMRFP